LGDGLQLLARPGAPISTALRERAAEWTASRAFDGTAVGCAALTALALGLVRNAAPSLWHDELVHIYVAQSLADTGRAALPSGVPYYNGTSFHAILAAVYAIFGNSETAMRAPSAIFAAINVVLTYVVLRPLLGRPAALVAAIGMALSPWNVAWSRQARFYTLHQGLYIAFIGAMWRVGVTQTTRRQTAFGLISTVVFAAGLLTSFHAIVFLAAPGLFAVAMTTTIKQQWKRWAAIVLGIGLAGIAGIFAIRALMNPVDRSAVIDNGGLGGTLVFPERSYRLYYLDWLGHNLSRGFLLLAVAGSVWMLVRERARGLYAALAFWAPLAVLTFLIGYRWPKFLFFAYPFFIAAWAYGLVATVRWLATPKPGWIRKLAALGLAIFLVRLGVSAFLLARDSVEAASGANVTLATRHPQWRRPCYWVRERLTDDIAVLSTTYLPVRYYAGRCDEWYPSRALPAEAEESGLPGLATTDDLAAFVVTHPNGYFIAEWWRFERNYKGAPWADFSDDIEWVESHMRKVDAASSADVSVYAWGKAPIQ